MSKQHFKFCPVCGEQSLIKDSIKLIKCDNCGLEWYQNPKSAANCVCVNSKYQILLAKRAFEPKKGLWGTPGGFVDPNENLEEAILREIKEELGLNLNSDRLNYLSSEKDRYLYQDWEYYTLGMLFEIKLTQNEIKNLDPQDDVSELKFFDIKDIPWQDLAFESTKNSLKNYFKKRALNPFNLQDLRDKIDLTDSEILKNLARRQEIVKLIGDYKKNQNIPVLDQKRWQQVLEKSLFQGEKLGLEKDFIQKIWEELHTYSKKIESL
jgi:NAD+ diphosphatase